MVLMQESGIYRTFINPQNYTGVQPIVDANTIYFDSFYWCVSYYETLLARAVYCLSSTDHSQHLGFIQISVSLSRLV